MLVATNEFNEGYSILGEEIASFAYWNLIIKEANSDLNKFNKFLRVHLTSYLKKAIKIFHIKKL